MIRSADVRTDSEVRSWEARLNRERPQRREVAAWITSQISPASAGSPRVVELACGAGFLAEVLKGQLSGLRYCGFDLSPHLLEYARRRLDGSPGEEGNATTMHFRRADLVRDNWTAQLVEIGWAGKVDAVVSIQALHDLGDLAQQKLVLEQARSLLREGGLLAYGDLLLDAENPHPSRYSLEEHEEMLRSCGFSVPGTSPTDCGRQNSGSRGFAVARYGEFGTFACCK
ncbi:MAG: class I SAM-dependent methyltransferase [Caldilineaceae bacterium]|nr:class I SAM-dependent methyltransferase [Caldilineaceae bacterium]